MATEFIQREAAIKRRHGCRKDCSICDFAIDGDSWCQGDVFVVDILSVPAADVIPVEWIEAQVDKGKWTELIQRWRETEWINRLM